MTFNLHGHLYTYLRCIPEDFCNEYAAEQIYFLVFERKSNGPQFLILNYRRQRNFYGSFFQQAFKNALFQYLGMKFDVPKPSVEQDINSNLLVMLVNGHYWLANHFMDAFLVGFISCTCESFGKQLNQNMSFVDLSSVLQ